jgi:DNA-binding PucR family transcriptional regulator
VAELAPAGDGSVVSYRGVSLTALLTSAPEAAIGFAQFELGELAEETDAARKLRGTLATYLDENLSAMRTARRMHVHQNTVVYRVKQAEEILGRTIEERRLELEVALRIAGGLGGLPSGPLS